MEKIMTAEGFKTKQHIAKHLSTFGLIAAIVDCRKCILLNINASYYYDEVSVYQTEYVKRTGRCYQ